MSADMDIGQIIYNGLNELLQKNDFKSVKNSDFTKMWCDMAMLPTYRIECIIQTSPHTRNGYNRDEGVIYGQLVRIFKNFCTQRRLVCERLMTTEIAAFWERMLLEDNINLQYFILNYESAKLTEFCLHSLKPEAYFEETIKDDIVNSNGMQSPWRKGLLASIYSTYEQAETSYEEVRKTKVKFLSISERFRVTGNMRLYDIAYRTKCHNIYGDWADMTKNHLIYNKNSNSFISNFDEREADLRQLNPMLIICCDTIIKFVEGISGHGISQALCEEVGRDRELIDLLDRMHVNYLEKKNLLDEIDLSLFQ